MKIPVVVFLVICVRGSLYIHLTHSTGTRLTEFCPCDKKWSLVKELVHLIYVFTRMFFTQTTDVLYFLVFPSETL